MKQPPWTTLWTVACLLALPVAAQAEDTVQLDGRIGGWNLTITTDQSGATVACSIQKQGDTTTAIGVTTTNQPTVMPFMENSAWQLRSGETYPAAYSVDQGPRHDAQAHVVTPTTVALLPKELEVFAAGLAQGERLYIHTADETIGLTLDGSRGALSWMRSCNERF